MDFTVKLLLLLIKLTLLSEALAANLNPHSKIIGGHEAKPNSHPYLVSLQLRFLWVRAHMCGGAILKENWVLSAAHCAMNSWILRFLPMDAVAGAHDVDTLGPRTQVIKIKDSISHPLYDGGIGPYDVAVFQTQSPFTFTKYIRPIQLPSTVYELNSMKLVGWGALRTTTFIPDLPGKLQEVDVTYIPFDECYEAIDRMLEDGETNPLDKEAHICTGPITGGVAACGGDSGGPLIIDIIKGPPYDAVEENTELYNAENYDCITQNVEDVSDATEANIGEDVQRESRQNYDYASMVVGIVSWGISPCGKKGAPTVYSNISSYIHFINYNINNN